MRQSTPCPLSSLECLTTRMSQRFVSLEVFVDNLILPSFCVTFFKWMKKWNLLSGSWFATNVTDLLSFKSCFKITLGQFWPFLNYMYQLPRSCLLLQLPQIKKIFVKLIMHTDFQARLAKDELLITKGIISFIQLCDPILLKGQLCWFAGPCSPRQSLHREISHWRTVASDHQHSSQGKEGLVRAYCIILPPKKICCIWHESVNFKKGCCFGKNSNIYLFLLQRCISAEFPSQE